MNGNRASAIGSTTSFKRKIWEVGAVADEMFSGGNAFPRPVPDTLVEVRDDDGVEIHVSATSATPGASDS